jgi:PAS domain S-box-containing protein
VAITHMQNASSRFTAVRSAREDLRLTRWPSPESDTMHPSHSADGGDPLTRTRTKQVELLGLWLALFILLGVAALAYRSVGAAADTLRWVEHTHEALHELEDVSAAYARSVSARRAYVVAGDGSQLGDASKLDAHVAASIAALRASIADNPSQLRRLDLLERRLDDRIAELDAGVERRRADGSAVETAEGLALAASVRGIREEIGAEENRLLLDRDARTRRDLASTKLAEVVGTLASIAILLFAFGRLRQEIARREHTERALRASEGFLESIVENIPHMIFVKGADELRFQRINRAGEQLLGVTREELVGKNDFDFFPAEQAKFFQERDRETLSNRVVVDIPEEPIQTKRGKRWLHTKKVPVVDEQGVPKFLLGISDDTTEQREVAVALKAAKEAAEAAIQELEAFSYSVAHDLRAPLRAIDGFSLALEEDCGDKLDAAGALHLKRVRTSAQHMARLIDGLLGLSRVTRGELVREKVDLTHLAQQAAARLRETAPDRQVDLVVQEGLEVEGDARLLTAALDNLLGNAWKFTGKCAHARVEVGRETDESGRVFFVRDNGAGFEQAYAQKLFGAFQRLHSVTEFEGSGIGLATVQRIVRRHGGRIWARGEVGRGATFYFTL